MLRWDEKWGELAAGETPNLAAETEMAEGPFPDSHRHRWQMGDPRFKPHGGLWALAPPGWLLSEPRLPPKAGRNSQVTVLVSALPAFLLPPETSCTRSPGARATSAGLGLSASHLVQFRRLWS